MEEVIQSVDGLDFMEKVTADVVETGKRTELKVESEDMTESKVTLLDLTDEDLLPRMNKESSFWRWNLLFGEDFVRLLKVNNKTFRILHKLADKGSGPRD